MLDVGCGAFIQQTRFSQSQITQAFVLWSFLNGKASPRPGILQEAAWSSYWAIVRKGRWEMRDLRFIRPTARPRAHLR